MISILFEKLGENILVIINGQDVKFGSTLYGDSFTDISGLRLDHKGVIKTFPHLEKRKDWRETAIFYFKEKIKSLKTEEDIANYIISDLRLHDFIPIYKQKKGFRPERI